MPDLNLIWAGSAWISFAWFISQAIIITSTQACTSDCQTTSCSYTSGCCQVTRGGARLPRVSVEHVRGLVREFKISLLDLTELADVIKTEWNNSDWWLPVQSKGLFELYPVSSNTAVLTNTLPGDQHRILRELRWWMTSIESQVQLIQLTGLINRDKSVQLSGSLRHISRSLTSLLRYFRVNFSSLPSESTCMIRSNSLTNSITRLAEFTSMAVKDLHQALFHIQNTLNSCTVVGQPFGQHYVRFDCQSVLSVSIFYPNPPVGLRLYNASQIISSSDEH